MTVLSHVNNLMAIQWSCVSCLHLVRTYIYLPTNLTTLLIGLVKVCDTSHYGTYMTLKVVGYYATVCSEITSKFSCM